MNFANILSEGDIILIIYLSVISVVGFILMGVDKSRAKKGKWRIKENTFMITSILGGAIGVIFGMIIFKHKTSKKKFYIGIPLLYIANRIIQFFIIFKK